MTQSVNYNVVVHTTESEPNVSHLASDLQWVNSLRIPQPGGGEFFHHQYCSPSLGNHEVIHAVLFTPPLNDGRAARASKHFYQKVLLPLVSDQSWVSTIANGPLGGADCGVDATELFFEAHLSTLQLTTETIQEFQLLLSMLDLHRHVFEDVCFWTALISLDIFDSQIVFHHKVTPKVL